MPQVEVVVFKDDDGSVPLLVWLDELPPKVQDKFIVRIERLAAHGHELRRPESAPLRDKIYELRVGHMRVNYRVLYFFHEGRAVLSHGLTKEKEVPSKEIDLAARRREAYRQDHSAHIYVSGTGFQN